MLFGWKRNQQKEKKTERLLQKEHFCEGSIGDLLIEFMGVSLSPVFHRLNFSIRSGNWIILFGPEDFYKALFCDLCFSYIKPDIGKVEPVLRGSDVSFLGRPNSTYGKTLIDHLNCGVKIRSREKMEIVVRNVFGPKLNSFIAKESSLVFAQGKKVSDLPLNERDYLEIAEANLLLQRRKAAIIDTSSKFYQTALQQGFRHSKLFLESRKTLIWIVGENIPMKDDHSPWRLYPEVEKSSLYFSAESPAGYIN